MEKPNRTLGKNGREVFLTTIVLLSVIAMSAAFAGAAMAEVGDADRQIDDTELAPGESTTVTVVVTMDETDAPEVIEKFDSAFADAEFASADPAPLFQVVEDDAAVVVWDEIETGETAAVEYVVTVPENASDGDTFSFDGEASSADGAVVDVTGDDMITVVEEEEETGIEDVLDAINAWQDGEMGIEDVLDAINAWQDS